MSAATSMDAGQPGAEHLGPDPDLEPRSTPTPVVVRRNAGLAALVGGAASAMAIAYLWRATVAGSPLDWVLCVVLAGIAAFHLANLVDARTPLLVADELGVRIRLGNQWRGLPWDAVGSVQVQPRRGLLTDGRLLFLPHSLGRALDGLDARGRRAAALNQKLYGAALAVPVGLTTRVPAHGQELSDELSALARSRTQIVLVQPVDADAPDGVEESPAVDGDHGSPWSGTEPAEDDHADLDTDDPDVEGGATAVEGARPGRRRLLEGLAGVVSRRRRGEDADEDVDAPVVDDDETGEDLGPDVATGPEVQVPAPREPAAARTSAVPFRATRHAARAQITRETPATVLGTAALLPEPVARARAAALPESRELRRPTGFGPEDGIGSTSAERVRPLASLGDPVDPLVIDDFVVEPAYDPVIGPELAAARTRVGLSVDELAERTRIRPHVIESIEVDDFAPCGGDFYARGHLRTLCRVLGRDPGPLLEQFDRRYATAPINARRVFEAELATGMTASTRSAAGGPNWALLVGAVLVLVLVWGVVRLFASEPAELLTPVSPAISAGTADDADSNPEPVGPLPSPVRLTLEGAQAGTRVVVRDRSGKVVWAGRLAAGERHSVRATPPVRVRAEDAGAALVTVDGTVAGPVGRAGQPATRTFRHPATR